MAGSVYYKDKVAVLRYHFLNDEESRFTISPDRFRTHLETLQNYGYTIIGMDHFLHFIRSGNVPPNAILITFDDGREDFYIHAYPELQKRGMPASNFLIMKEIDEPDGIIRYLNWEQIREMRDHGFSFFNHTYSHHRRFAGNSVMTGPIYSENLQRMETYEEYRERIKKDLELAEQRLYDELGAQPKLFCFPYGEYNEAMVAAAKEIGIELCFTIEEGINDRTDSLVYRLNAGEPSVSAQKLLHMIQLYHD